LYTLYSPLLKLKGLPVPDLDVAEGTEDDGRGAGGADDLVVAGDEDDGAVVVFLFTIQARIMQTLVAMATDRLINDFQLGLQRPCALFQHP
jgi:hypothetical protein